MPVYDTGTTDASSADSGVTITLGAGAFAAEIKANTIFRITSGALSGVQALVASRDSSTQLTLQGLGVGANFTNQSWVVYEHFFSFPPRTRQFSIALVSAGVVGLHNYFGLPRRKNRRRIE